MRLHIRYLNKIDHIVKKLQLFQCVCQVIWVCLVEDSALFLRYVLERLTRDRQDQMFKLLRHLIRFVPRLPQQAAFALYNYIIGYVMFYVRSSHECSQQVSVLYDHAALMMAVLIFD